MGRHPPQRALRDAVQRGDDAVVVPDLDGTVPDRRYGLDLFRLHLSAEREADMAGRERRVNVPAKPDAAAGDQMVAAALLVGRVLPEERAGIGQR